ncbi:28S ribosomal protein S25, mitochondrial [Goodea atripinnis]|uniref:28S ribosomal protein S25, mitochondrial n=1 Tax=Goodea atripinnis TaxID=208336 RepID=A0ABV0MSD7_9TELE
MKGRYPIRRTLEYLQKGDIIFKNKASNPANFGPKKYCLRECICEVESQVPCPSTTPLPKEMTGKYRAKMAESQE